MPESNPRKLSDEELRSIVDYWKPRLGIQPWNIIIRYGSVAELGDHDIIGTAYRTKNIRCAKIVLQSPEVCQEEHIPYIPEHVIIHELIHVAFWFDESMRENDTLRQLWEQGIEQLAWALYNERYSHEPAA